jgi:GTP cyclohydrolase I
LSKTPNRVLQNYTEFFSGYNKNPSEVLGNVFEKNKDVGEIVLLKGIKFISFCEHHMLPIDGLVNIAYIPTKGVIGFDRISQLVDVFTRRMQLQERITTQIAESLYKYVAPEGVAVSVSAYHKCMSLVGSKKDNISVYTEKTIGLFKINNNMYDKFLAMTLEK